MKLWLLSQDENTGYDTYDSVVVAAKSEEEARLILPSEYQNWEDGCNYSWVNDPKLVKVELIGTAVRGTKVGVVLASFNAG